MLHFVFRPSVTHPGCFDFNQQLFAKAHVNRFAAFLRFFARFHSSSRRSISAFGTATTARNRLSIFWKGVQPGMSIGGLEGFILCQS